MTTDHAVEPLALEPGDRLMFLTDGILERNAATVDVHSVIAAGRC
jgi:serine phosphatase RsbU (regulator of sigma subunit)